MLSGQQMDPVYCPAPGARMWLTRLKPTRSENIMNLPQLWEHSVTADETASPLFSDIEFQHFWEYRATIQTPAASYMSQATVHMFSSTGTRPSKKWSVDAKYFWQSQNLTVQTDNYRTMTSLLSNLWIYWTPGNTK